MIPILYENTETSFTSNGLGRLRDCISCVCVEGRNDVYEVDFEYPVTGINYEKIKLGRIIAVEHDDSDDIQPFDIVSCSRPINGVVSFHAVHISYRQSGLTVSGTNINSLADAFTALGSSTPTNPFSYFSDKTNTGYVASFDGIPRSVRSILGGVEGSILDAYGGEYEFDKFNVNLWASRGQARSFTIRYGVNLIDYNEDLDYSDSYTSVVPYWVGSSGGAVVQGSKVSSGINLFNRETCVPMDLTEKFETQPTTAQLESMASSILASNEPYLPSQNITVDFIRLQDADEYSQFEDLLECKLCDTVRVVFPMYGMSGSFKIVKTEYNVLLEKYNSMELGTLSTSLAEALGVDTSTSGDSSNKTFTLKDVDSSSTTIASGSTKWITVSAPSTGAIYVGYYVNGATPVSVYCARQTTTGAQFAIRNYGSSSVTFVITTRFLVYN